MPKRSILANCVVSSVSVLFCHCKSVRLRRERVCELRQFINVCIVNVIFESIVIPALSSHMRLKR